MSLSKWRLKPFHLSNFLTERKKRMQLLPGHWHEQWNCHTISSLYPWERMWCARSSSWRRNLLWSVHVGEANQCCQTCHCLSWGSGKWQSLKRLGQLPDSIVKREWQGLHLLGGCPSWRWGPMPCWSDCQRLYSSIRSKWPKHSPPGGIWEKTGLSPAKQKLWACPGPLQAFQAWKNLPQPGLNC